MPWALNLNATGDNAAQVMRDQYAELYPDAPDVQKEQVDAAVTCVDTFLTNSGDTELFQISASGHAVLDENERPFIALNVNPIVVSEPAKSTGKPPKG